MSKKTIYMIVILLVLVGGYFYVSGGEDPASSNSLLLSAGYGGSVDASLLNQLKALQIDTSFFKSPEYVSLVDYSVDIATQNVGRPNPFAPIPGVSNPLAPEPAGIQAPTAR